MYRSSRSDSSDAPIGRPGIAMDAMSAKPAPVFKVL